MVTPNDGHVNGTAGTDNVTIQNSPPVADAQNVNTIEDIPVDITLTGSDVDEDILTFAITAGPSSGNLTPAVDFSTSGNLTYTPVTGFTGADNFTFKVSDGTDNSTAEVDINVQSSLPTMRVDNIQMVLVKKYGGWRTYAQATVSVVEVDNYGNPVAVVENATVNGHWEGATSDTESGLTDADGMITFTSNYQRFPSSGTEYIFRVDEVSKQGYYWDDDNSVISGIATVP